MNIFNVIQSIQVESVEKNQYSKLTKTEQFSFLNSNFLFRIIHFYDKRLIDKSECLKKIYKIRKFLKYK